MSGDQPSPNKLQKLLQRIAATNIGSWFFSYFLHHIDRALLNITNGRVSTVKILAGLPTIKLTTTGAKTGKKRTVPVMGIKDNEKWVLIASNWGKKKHPAWYHNLKANPTVEINHNETEEYTARTAEGVERTRYWNKAKDLYIGFEAYRKRSGERQIPVVVLTPKEE